MPARARGRRTRAGVKCGINRVCRINIFLLLSSHTSSPNPSTQTPDNIIVRGRPPRAEIRTRTNVARRRPALWGPGKHLGRHDFRPSRARCGVRAPAAAPPRSRHVPRACAGCRIIDRPVPGAGRGRENRAAPQSAATVSGPDRWAGAGGRRSPYGPARTSGRYGSGARCSIGASAKVIFGTGPLGFDYEMAIAVLVAHGNRG